MDILIGIVIGIVLMIIAYRAIGTHRDGVEHKSNLNAMKRVKSLP
jgi:hypothetical protein